VAYTLRGLGERATSRARCRSGALNRACRLDVSAWFAAKPVIDIDIIVERQHVDAAISALADAGYVHRGDLGVTDREASDAPDDGPARNVYVCVEGTLHLRNHLAVREVLRRRADLRERYGAVKLKLSRDPEMDIITYIAEKSDVLQDVLASSDLSDDEKALIRTLNTRR